MTHVLALLGGAVFIILLYWGGKNRCGKVSNAVWLPWIWGLLLCSRSPLAWFESSSRRDLAARFTDSNPAEIAIYSLLLVAALLVLNFRASKVCAILLANAPLLLFCLFCLVSMLWSDFPFMVLKRWIKGMGTLAMVLVLLTEEQPREAIERVLIRMAYLLLPLSALLILFFPQFGRFYDSTDHILYYIGVTTQKNELGLLSMICGLACLWSFLRAVADREGAFRVRRMITNGLMVLLAYVLIKTCDSMTSFSCLTAGGIVMLLLRRTHRMSGIHWLVGGIVSLATFASLLDSSGILLRMLGRDATLTGRTGIWKAVLQLQTNPLLGTGFESFWTEDRIERVWQIIGFKGIAETHNGYLEIYINLGWIGVLLLTLLIFTGYRNALHGFWIDPAMGRLQIAFFTACLIFNLSEAGFRMMSPCWMVFLLAAMAYAPSGERLNRSSLRGEPFARSAPHEVKILY
jgi:O-antigen ligase